MQIHGLNKTTLLDYPGMVASTVFTGACNFRCPFCQNSDLVLDPSSQPVISENEIIDHLRKRKGIIKGVCVTGGEPTINKDLPEFLKKLKAEDVKVKLDTNGYNPEMLRFVIKEKLCDYIAMDIKSSFSGYSISAGISIDTEKIKESIELIMNEGILYEFRTTVVRELHNEETFEEIGEMLKGARSYYLQCFKDSERVLKPGLHPYSREELEKFAGILRKTVNSVEIRGID